MNKVIKWKIIYALVFQLLVYLFSEFFEYDNILVIIGINVILYVIPYYVTVHIIRSKTYNDFKSIAKCDLIFYLIPALISSPIYESIAVILSRSSGKSNGVYSATLMIIYILIYFLYLLIYKITINNIKKSLK